MIAIGGRSGTGKSALARAAAPALAPIPGAVVLRSDVERKAMLGQDENARLPPEAYAPGVTLRVYATIADKARRAAAAGHSAIMDAVFAQPSERVVAERSAAALGIPFRGFFLEAPLATRLQRVGARTHDASDADAAILRAQESYNVGDDLGAPNWTRIDASGSLDETLQRIRERLR